MLPKTSAYVKSYDRQSKWMCFLIEDNDLLEKYNTICDKVSPDIKKEFDKIIKKIIIRHINDKFFSFSDNSNDFVEE